MISFICKCFRAKLNFPTYEMRRDRQLIPRKCGDIKQVALPRMPRFLFLCSANWKEAGRSNASYRGPIAMAVGPEVTWIGEDSGLENSLANRSWPNVDRNLTLVLGIGPRCCWESFPSRHYHADLSSLLHLEWMERGMPLKSLHLMLRSEVDPVGSSSSEQTRSA